MLRYGVLVCFFAALGALALQAQSNPAPQDGPAPATRAEEIETKREIKSRQLAPDSPGRIESILFFIKEHQITERLTSGVAGFRVRLGGLITGSGLALGPEFYRRDLARGEVTFRASARGSIRRFYLMDAELGVPSVAGDHVFLDLYAVHRNYPNIDYYGPGSRSAKTGRSGFELEDTAFQTRFGVKPLDRLRLGVIGKYLLVNVSQGRDDRFISTDRIYTEQTTPGLQFQSDFLQSGAFVQYDWRDYPGEPRNGGNYVAQYSTYFDIQRHRYSFNRLDLEAQQYIGFFNDRRTIALRGRLQAAEARSGNLVPFYLQPTLGGSDDLRGFRSFRFYDNSAVIFNGEYRWEVFSGLDMALFADAGRVFPDWRKINLRHLEGDAGFGFRFNVRNSVFMRIDTAFSREGFQAWLKFGNVF